MKEWEEREWKENSNGTVQHYICTVASSGSANFFFVLFTACNRF